MLFVTGRKGIQAIEKPAAATPNVPTWNKCEKVRWLNKR